jgi:hypothetical protein
MQKLLLTLGSYATGSFLIISRDVIGVSKSSACLIIRDVSLAIAKLQTKYVKMLKTLSEIQDLQTFIYNLGIFPLVIEAIH